MAKVIGFDPKLMKQCTCRNCAAIIEYSLTEVKKHIEHDYDDDSEIVYTITCPNCGNNVTVKAR